MARAALGLGAALLWLGGCSALPSLEDVVPPPPPDAAAIAAERDAFAAALAGGAAACLDARDAGRTLADHVEAAGNPRRIGLRPAPAPLRGWVVRSGRANLYEDQGRCYVEPVGAPPMGTVAALRAALTTRTDHALTETEPPRVVEGTFSRWYTEGGQVRAVLIAPADDAPGDIVVIVTGRV